MSFRNNKMRQPLMRWSATLAMLMAAATGLADERAERADTLFREARVAMQKDDFASAYPKLIESQRLDPAPGTQLNLAQCEEKLGRFAAAFEHYQNAAKQFPQGDERIQIAQRGASVCEAFIAKVSIKLPPHTPRGTKILCDTKEVTQSALAGPIPVDPGDHEVVVRARGHNDSRYPVSLRAGESRDLMTEIGPAFIDPGEENAARDPAPEEPEKPTDSNTQRYVGYTAGALGVVGLGVGTAFWLKARSMNNEMVKNGCTDSTCPFGSYNQTELDTKTLAARSAATTGNIAFGAGALMFAGGLALVLTAPSKPTGTGARVSISPVFGTGSAGMGIGGAL